MMDLSDVSVLGRIIAFKGDNPDKNMEMEPRPLLYPQHFPPRKTKFNRAVDLNTISLEVDLRSNISLDRTLRIYFNRKPVGPYIAGLPASIRFCVCCLCYINSLV